MRRRSGQSGQIVKKGNYWYVRFYEDVAGVEHRVRRIVQVGPVAGEEKLTKAEAKRKGAEIVASRGVNTAEPATSLESA